MTSTARLVDELRAVGLIGVAAEAVTYPEPVVPVETVRAAPAPVAPSADDKLVELLAVANTLRKASEALVNAAALCEQLATRAAPVAKAAEVVLIPSERDTSMDWVRDEIRAESRARAQVDDDPMPSYLSLPPDLR